jgi:hypothetical protein
MICDLKTAAHIPQLAAVGLFIVIVGFLLVLSFPLGKIADKFSFSTSSRLVCSIYFILLIIPSKDDRHSILRKPHTPYLS